MLCCAARGRAGCCLVEVPVEGNESDAKRKRVGGTPGEQPKFGLGRACDLHTTNILCRQRAVAMAPDRLPQAPGKGQQNAKKRKDAPTASSKGNNDSNKRPKMDHRAKQRDARQLSTQTSGKAFKNGELDVDKFVRAREYEIRALEEGMARSKKALNRRAFQQVPKELRRRTASHNVKRVPKKLQARSKREVRNERTTKTIQLLMVLLVVLVIEAEGGLREAEAWSMH